jgi:hypothetical protein
MFASIIKLPPIQCDADRRNRRRWHGLVLVALFLLVGQTALVPGVSHRARLGSEQTESESTPHEEGSKKSESGSIEVKRLARACRGQLHRTIAGCLAGTGLRSRSNPDSRSATGGPFALTGFMGLGCPLRC